MFRKTLFAALLAAAIPCAALAQTAPTTVPDSAKMQEARAIIAVMFPTDQRDQKIHDMMVAMMTQMKGSIGQLEGVDDPGLQAILDRYMESVPNKMMPAIRKYFPSMLEATAEAYAHEFSLEELKQIRAFAETPAGHHYFSKVTDVLKAPSVAKANEAFFKGIQGLQKQDVAALKQEVMAYLQAHPEVLKKLQASHQ